MVIVVMFALFFNLSAGKYKEDGIYAEIDTPKGLIVAKLFFEKAPMTVANFVGLAEGSIKNSAKKPGEPFYDNGKFHRVVPDFVIQGGDPQGTGMGGPGYDFPNEIHSDLKHSKAGIMAMANAGPHTNGCQFYFTLQATPHLDGGYSVFGEVIQGLDFISKIAANDAIKTIRIVRQGDKAKAFDASEATFRKKVDEAKKNIKEQGQAKLKEANKEVFEKAKKYSALLEKEKDKLITTKSGLKYYVLKKVEDAKKPAKGNEVTVNYIGMFTDGEIFDSSFFRNQPFTFPVGVGKVIKGWDEGLMEMKKGEQYLFLIPPALGYGERGAGNVIPPNSMLVFFVELLNF
jgi:peptidylprolyl isomerase